MSRSLVCSVVAAGCVGASSAPAQVITVDIIDDIIDIDPATATMADLPGPDGHISLSEALIASNNTPGHQTIGFAIPESQWTYLPWLYPGRAVLHTVVGFYWRSYDEVTIDGTTQTAFTGDTNPDGWEIVLRGPTLYLNADNCVVRGLDNSVVSLTRSNGRVEDNTQMGIEVFGGSGSLIRNNTAGYIQIDRSSDNVVLGNTVSRLRVLGWVGGGQPASNNRIGGPAPDDRNYIVGLGTYDSEGYPSGFAVQLFDTIGTVIENNRIGTTPDGMQQGHQATTAGILFEGENNDTLIRNNQIAGILGRGVGPHFFGRLGDAISVYGTGSGVTITGNAIGLDATGAATLGSVTGISTRNYYLGPVEQVRIGGPGALDGNEIAGHLQAGVSVANTYRGVQITGNSIHDNGGLGIDLITDRFETGVTPNDPLDPDTGGNGLQNFPVLEAATASPAGTLITGTFNSLPGEQFRLEFFASERCDPAGHGEGADFLGAGMVTTDGAGNAPVSVALDVAAPAGALVTATATHVPTGSTSEFSACVAVEGSGFADCDGDGELTFFDFLCFQNLFAAGDPGADCDGDGS
ncbi:MAG: right-handed parallel beta-helix repeat-containing protein, partial [Phycisphaerales bacterium JB039]